MTRPCGPGGGVPRAHVRSGMLPFASRRRRTRWIRPVTALVAMVLQLVLVAASVAEFRDAPGGAAEAEVEKGDGHGRA